MYSGLEGSTHNPCIVEHKQISSENFRIKFVFQINARNWEEACTT